MAGFCARRWQRLEFKGALHLLRTPESWYRSRSTGDAGGGAGLWKQYATRRNQRARDLRRKSEKPGAGEGNRTLVSSLGSYSSAIELHPHINNLGQLLKSLGTDLAPSATLILTWRPDVLIVLLYSALA